jgi:hypothetical protein
MKKNYQTIIGKIAILLFFFQFSTLATAQIVHSESFDSTLFLPPGWSTIGGTANWSRVSTLLAPLDGNSHSGEGMARMRYPINQTVTFHTESIVTPSFTLEGRGNNTPIVSFWIYRDSLETSNPDSLAVYINTSLSLTGATRLGIVSRLKSVNLPNVQALNGWYQYSYAIPSGYNTETNYLIFKGTVYGPQSLSRRIYLDDINWDEYPVLCSGAPTAGNVSASDSLFCGNSGPVDFTLLNGTSDLGITHAWFSAPTPSGPWSTFGSNSTNASLPNVTSTTYIRCSSFCSYSNQSSNTSPLQILVSQNPTPVVEILSVTDTICSGDNLTLYASGANSYQWSTASNPTFSSSSTITISPPITRVYTLVGTDADGCESLPVTKTIVVGARPTINNLSNSLPVLCQGGSSLLSVNASAGTGVTLSYLWSPTLESTATISASPTVTTEYIVTVYGQYGCFRKDTTVVTIDGNLVGPVVTMNYSNLNVCAGATGNSIIAASTSTPGATFQWSTTAGGTITSVNDTISVAIPFQTESYTVLVTNPANGCNSTGTSTITVRPIPSTNLVATNQTVCLNGSTVINLFIGNTGGDAANTYTAIWTPAGLIGPSVIVNPTSTGYQSVNVTSQYGCSKMDSILITVDPTQVGPTVSLTASDLEFCEGDSTNVSLYVSSNDPQVSYLWSPSSIVGTNDTVLVSPTSTTVYTVSATNLLGCTSSESVTVSFGAPPTPSFTHITGGINDAYFTNTSTNAETSHWYFGDGTDVFADNPSHIYPTAGVYVVKLVVISPAGCKDSIISQILVGTATIDEVNESNSLEFNVYPNPSKGLFNIKLNSKDLSSTITVMNLLGEVILTKDLVQTANGNFESQIDLSNYPNGIYLIDMSTENQTVVRKISKQ